MGILDIFFGEKDSEYKELIPYFQEVFNLLIEYCIKQIDEGKKADSVTIGTSASALIAASYFVNTVRVNQDNTEIQDHVVEVSNQFFDYISGILAKIAQKEMGKKINMDQWLYPVTEIQQDKVGKYILAIINSLKKISSGQSGYDISNVLTEDIFGKETVVDPLFHLKIIHLIYKVKL